MYNFHFIKKSIYRLLILNTKNHSFSIINVLRSDFTFKNLFFSNKKQAMGIFFMAVNVKVCKSLNTMIPNIF